MRVRVAPSACIVVIAMVTSGIVPLLDDGPSPVTVATIGSGFGELESV